MDATFSGEQVELRRAVRDVAADRCTSAGLRVFIASGAAYDEALWQLLATDLGLVGIAVSEDRGGAGGTFIDAAVVLEESGRALFPVPLLGSLVVATMLDAALDAPAALGVTDGTIGADGPTTRIDHILDGAAAQRFVIAAPDGLFAVDRGDARVQAVAGLDLTRGQARLTFDSAVAQQVGDATASARAVDVLRVALSLEAVGLTRRCLELSVDYLKTRVQFGKPIGAFQALQHRAADLAVTVEAAASTAYYAAWAVAESPAELSVVAPLALSVCGETAYQVAAETIQLHGGIGFTWEHDAHLFFKRATTLRLLLGDSHEQRRLVAARTGIAAATR